MTEDLLDAPDIYGETIFCDDIRHEVDGKVSYIGVYQGAMTLSGRPPFTIAKFGFAISFSQKQEIFEPKITMKVFLPGDAEDRPSIEGEATGEAPVRQTDPEGSFIVLKGLFVVSPLVIREAGRIRVRIFCGGKQYKSGALYVRFADLPATSPSDVSPPA